MSVTSSLGYSPSANNENKKFSLEKYRAGKIQAQALIAAAYRVRELIS